MLKPGDRAAVVHCPGVPNVEGQLCTLVGAHMDNYDGESWVSHGRWDVLVDGYPAAAMQAVRVEELAEWEKELLASQEPNPYTSDKECVADVKVTRLDGQTFTLENIRVESVSTEGDHLVMEGMPAFPVRLFNIPLSTIAYWEQA